MTSTRAVALTGLTIATLIAATESTAAAQTRSPAGVPVARITGDPHASFRPDPITVHRTPSGTPCTLATVSLRIHNKTDRAQVVTVDRKTVERIAPHRTVGLCIYVQGSDVGGVTYHLRENPDANLLVVVT